MPLLQPENVGKISGKLLVESVVAPVGRRVPEDYSPNLVGFYETWAYWFFLDYRPNKSSCILEDYRTFFCGLNSDLCHLGGSKNLGPRNWRFSSTVHVFTLPTQKREKLPFRLVFYHLSNGLHDVFLLASRYIPVLKIWDRNKKNTRIWPPCLASPPPGGTREQPRPSY